MRSNIIMQQNRMAEWKLKKEVTVKVTKIFDPARAYCSTCKKWFTIDTNMHDDGVVFCPYCISDKNDIQAGIVDGSGYCHNCSEKGDPFSICRECTPKLEVK